MLCELEVVSESDVLLVVKRRFPLCKTTFFFLSNVIQKNGLTNVENYFFLFQKLNPA